VQLWMGYAGHGVNFARQEAPHVHSVVFSPDDKWYYVQDLGLDRISVRPFDSGMAIKIFGRRAMIFETDWVPGKRADSFHVSTIPGSGPRHLTFSPNGRYAYLLEEMGGSVDVYRYHPENGRLDSLQRIAAHVSDTLGPFRSADIHVSPDGRFLYASNRAESNIAIFSIDPATGLLTTVGYQPTFGKEPRNFTLDPSGRWLLVANQDSNAIVVFRVDRETGLLERTGKTIEVPAPTCLKMLR
jgi:6-phosphogluconolactonase